MERKGVTEGEGRSLSAFQAELLLRHFLVRRPPSVSAASRSVSQDPDPWFLVAANSASDSLQGQGREVERKCLALSSGEGC